MDTGGGWLAVGNTFQALQGLGLYKERIDERTDGWGGENSVKVNDNSAWATKEKRGLNPTNSLRCV